LSLQAERIGPYISQLEKEAKAFKDEALKLSWFMRGGLSYDDALLLSSSERESINSLIKENLDTTKKSGLPFF
jgi:hypothetical protein